MTRTADCSRRDRPRAAGLCLVALSVAFATASLLVASPLQAQTLAAFEDVRIASAPSLTAISALPVAGAAVSAQSSPRRSRDDVRDSREPRRQEGPTMGLAYSMAFPFRDLRDFDEGMSFRGIDLSFAFPVVRALQFGVALSYNGFYHEGGPTTYPFDSGAVTAKLYVAADFWSLAFMARYFLVRPISPLRPWIGLRVGTSVLSTTTFVADREAVNTAAGALLMPELGLAVRLVEPLHVSAVYQYHFTTNEVRSYERLSYGALQLGMMFKFQ